MNYTRLELDPEVAKLKIILCKEDPFFVSPQGEGSFMGRMSAWMRTSTCNLRCAWANPDGTVTLCDTAYTSHAPQRNIVNLSEAYDYLMSNNAPHVVLTGGEPSQQKSVIKLVDLLEDSGKRVTMETNGTNFFESKATLISMSPKLESSSSGLQLLSNPEYNTPDTDSFVERNISADKRPQIYKKYLEIHNNTRYNPESFKKFMEYYGSDRYQFKFVANAESDIEEILRNYVEPLQIPSNNIYLMPQGTSHEQLNSRAEWVVEQCKKYGWHYSDRIHVRIWGHRSGV